MPILGHNRGPTFSLTRRACQALDKVLAKIKVRDTAPVGSTTHRAGSGEEGLSRLPADFTDRPAAAHFISRGCVALVH